METRSMTSLPSSFDIQHFPIARDFINSFLKQTTDHLNGFRVGTKWLEIGPQERDAVRKTYPTREIYTLDVVNDHDPDIVGDITMRNDHIDSESFSGIFCLDVLEHVVDPFAAISELSRILENGGFLVMTTPLNARIHGPVPDCWRFTEFGLKVMLRNFNIKVFEKLDTEGRNLFPLQYAVLAFKDKTKNINPRDIKFQYID